jgi:aminopeptidase-like protein
MHIKKYYKIGKNILFPFCRSITGYGTKQTLKIIKNEFPRLKIHKVRSGTKVFDWKIPPEWNIFDAYVLDKDNKKIIDFKKNNLHIVSYSTPIKKKIIKKELLNRIHSIPSMPNAIPYVTSYYKKYWGFCDTNNIKKKINKKYKDTDRFLVKINSKFNYNGNLEYGEYTIKGKSNDEILISTYICHPSMANNELSGIIISMSLINYFKKFKNLKKTLKFLFIPETIGSITYLSKNLNYLKKNLIGGYNLSCIGDNRMHSCMFTKYGNSASDLSLMEAYKKLKIKYKIHSFLERGSDERQYNSPGIDLPIASIFRTKYGEYPEYHTSLDNFDVLTKKGLQGGFLVSKTAIKILLEKIVPRNKILCEPNMGKRKLYPTLSENKIKQSTKDIMNFLTYADGKNDLLTISKYIKKKYTTSKKIYKLLKTKRLIK